jgi:hypothetical protein
MNTVVMAKVKDCVHSTPFKTKNENGPISSVYINKNHKLANEAQVVLEWDETTITIKGV